MNNVKSASGLTPSTNGLMLHYDPNNLQSYPGSGSIIYDLSVNGINGTVTGSPPIIGNAFVLNGSSYIMSGDITVAKGTNNSHTVEVWVKPSLTCAGWIDKGAISLTSGYRSTGLEFYSVGPFSICNTLLWNGQNTRMGGGNVTYNTWYQIVRTYNGTQAIAYVNKTAATATTFTWSPPQTWYIGFGASTDASYFSTGAAFQGSYGVMRVYNRALTSTEVIQNYNATKSKYGL